MGRRKVSVEDIERTRVLRIVLDLVFLIRAVAHVLTRLWERLSKVARGVTVV